MDNNKKGGDKGKLGEIRLINLEKGGKVIMIKNHSFKMGKRVFFIGFCVLLNFGFAFSSRNDTIPPDLTLAISSVGDSVSVCVTSDESLYNGWLQEKLLHTFYNWDYYGLYTRLVCDAEDEIHSAVWLRQHNAPNDNFYYHRLDKNGNIIEAIPEWNGPHGHPIVTDASGKKLYIDQPTPLGEDGVTDTQGNSHIVNTEGMRIRYTKIDSAGNMLIDNITIVDDASSWTGCARIVCDTEDILYVFWSRDLHEICYVKSVDGGNTWSTTNSFGQTSWRESGPEVVTDREDNIHIIWMDARNGGGFDYELYYKKLYPSGMISVNDTRLTDYSVIGSVWRPRICIDFENNIYIIWEDWFTKINGNLDKNGSAATNEEITLIEDSVIPRTYSMGRSKPVADSWDNIHVTASSGGNPGDDCGLFYQKFVVSPVVFVTCPDSTRHRLEMVGSGTQWSGSFIVDSSGYYYIEASGSDTAGNIGYADTIFQYLVVEEEIIVQTPTGIGFLQIYPNPFREKTKITFSLEHNAKGAELNIYDITGRLVRSYSANLCNLNKSVESVYWDGKDDMGKSLSNGIYICRLKADNSYKATAIIMLK